MTRFNITLDQAVDVVVWSIKISRGKLLVPKLPSYRIIDVAKAINLIVNLILLE